MCAYIGVIKLHNIVCISHSYESNSCIKQFDSTSLQVVGASVVVANITGLRAYTNYTVQVAAVNDQGQEGPLSQPVSVFTPEAGMSIRSRYSNITFVYCTYESMSWPSYLWSPLTL